MKNIILGIVGVVLIAFIVISSSGNKKANDPVLGETINETYTSSSGEEVSAVFSGGAVTFYWGGVEVTLPQAISASGARYANEDESLVFWNKGEDVTIYENDTIIFEGSASVEVDNNVQDNQVSEADPLVSSLVANEWVWEKTVMNDDTVIEPKQAGDFTLTFANDGRVSGKTDCNGFNASYEILADKQISFGQAAMTLMFCEGSQEEIFMQNVVSSTGVFFDEQGNLALLLPFDSGSVLFIKK